MAPVPLYDKHLGLGGVVAAVLRWTHKRVAGMGRVASLLLRHLYLRPPRLLQNRPLLLGDYFSPTVLVTTDFDQLFDVIDGAGTRRYYPRLLFISHQRRVTLKFDMTLPAILFVAF